MHAIRCPVCKGPAIEGDVRSGAASFGGFFIGHDGDQRTLAGASKPKGILQQDNRALSFAGKTCGHVSSFLERAIRDQPDA